MFPWELPWECFQTWVAVVVDTPVSAREEAPLVDFPEGVADHSVEEVLGEVGSPNLGHISIINNSRMTYNTGILLCFMEKQWVM